jgi:hypothetical protein
MVIELGPAIVVPGHGEVTNLALVEAVRDYLVTMRDEAAAAKRDGLTADQAVETLASAVRERHPDWENPEWIDFAIRCFHDQAE